ncbi:UNVERIFIED_ORG: hypothetical protein J2W38_001522 [Variovorax paradoxus]|nr:hypothetical protein [Variovorax paradoxus]
MQKTEGIWEDAQLRAPDLARALARIELTLGNWEPIAVSRDALEVAIQSGWLSTIASAREGRVSLDRTFIVSLHEPIARALGAPGIGVFREGEHPSDWTTFKSALDDTAQEYSLAGNTEAWVLAQLYWGKHLDSLMFSVAWLLSGGIRLQEGMQMLVPDARHDLALQKHLDWASPRCYDAEGLRGLFGLYAAEQVPDLSNA